MSELLKWLTNNSGITMMLLASLTILILVIVFMYIIAFSQGRYISFWPPHIGDNNKSKPSKNNFLDRPKDTNLKDLDIASIHKYRSWLFPKLFDIFRTAQKSIKVVAMGAGTIIDIRGREYLRSFLEKKLAEQKFENFTIVLFNPEKPNYQSRIKQLNLSDQKAEETEVRENIKFLKSLNKANPKIKLRFYRDFFQPSFMMICIDDKRIFFSLYFNQVVGRHCPILMEFTRGGISLNL